MTLICTDLDKKLQDLKDSTPYVDTWQDIARYCGVTPPTVTYWRDTGKILASRLRQLEELFDLPPGTLLREWHQFKEVLKTLKFSSNPWKRLLIQADPHSLLEIRRREGAPADLRRAQSSRMIPEDEPDDEPNETYLHGERVFLQLALPSALSWAKQAVVLAKIGEVVRALCPSALCPDTALEPEVTHFPRDIAGTVFKTTGEGVQTLLTVLLAELLPKSLTQQLHAEAARLPEELLQQFAVAVKARPERERHIYRRDYRVYQLPPGLQAALAG